MEGLTPLRNSRYRNMDISTEDAIVFLQRNPQYLQHEANPYSVDKYQYPKLPVYNFELDL